MKESKKRNILAIADGLFEVMPVIYGIDQSFKLSEYIFEYCALKGIKGQSFKRLCEDHKFLPVRVGSYILKKMDKDKFRPLTVSDLL